MARKTAAHADVVIVGGGLVGGALAIALSDAGFDVAVVDRVSPERALRAQHDGRAFAIALSSKRALTAIGVWKYVQSSAAPIRDIRVCEAGSPFHLHYDHREVGDEPFGFMVEAQRLRHAIVTRMSRAKRVRLIAPAPVDGLETTESGARVTLAGGGSVAAPLVVGADGRNSQMRALAGIRAVTWSYGQTAIVCTVAHARAHEFAAHERFLPGGPFAILPLKGRRSSIVWAERNDLAPALLALEERDFLRELGRRFGDFLGTLKLAGPVSSFPLSLRFAERATARRFALVGDANHAIHPIAGQGLNMGFRDAAALAEVLLDARRLGLEGGEASVLDRYASWRRFDNTLMMAATDGLTRLFSNGNRPLRFVRNLGLAAVNGLAPLKGVFMRHAMGTLGTLPKLMQGQDLRA
ncbi:MAG: 2-octaprenyl-6-methoxyphenyl hydroxylase [Rhodospirillales bacterium]|nr:2-octaprenyl-6-methoxyphenyl hydroxylase [Rhodospirillales bacterium]